MENLATAQNEQSTDTKESVIVRELKYERVISDFFRKIGLKPNQCQLIRAFISASKGETLFEISFSELANILFDENDTSPKVLRERVRSWLNTLLKWQEQNEIELIRVVTRGCKTTNESGRYEYQKTIYEFVMLNDFVKILHSESIDLATELDAIIKRIKTQYQPPAKMRKYHPRHNRRKAKNTILTKLKNIFKYSVLVDRNPAEYCWKVLDDASEQLEKMEAKWIEEQNQEKTISDFESMLEESEIFQSEEQNMGLEG